MANFKDDDIQNIRERVNIVEIIGEHVPLRKAGRTYRGLCPFHGEKTPSFHIDPAKQLYHCFGCGAGGDVFTFLMKSEGLDFNEAVENLARKAGYTLTKTVGVAQGVKSRLLLICEAAADFYRSALNQESGRQVREYLNQRELQALSEEFRLGYSPDWSSSIDFLRRKGFSDEFIIKAGLGAVSSRGSVYDRFHHRLIFSICDSQGRPIAFGGRVIDNSLPKYINSPETPLYHKGSVLFGLSRAKNSCMKRGEAIVVEGYTDLLSLVGAGIDNAVATLGTAFTADHLRILSRFAQKIILVFDGDQAGLAAAERSSQHLDTVEILVAALPDNLDPADFLSQRGAERFQEQMGLAKPLVEFLIDRIILKHQAKKSGKLMAAQEGAKVIANLSSPVAKEEYLRYLGDRLTISYEALAAEISGLLPDRKAERKPSSAGKAVATAEREFLKLVLRKPEKAGFLDDLGVEEWQEPQLRRLGAVLKALPRGKRIPVGAYMHKIDFELQGLVSELLLEPVLAEDHETYFDEIYFKLKERSLDREIYRTKKLLEQTEVKNIKYNETFEKLLSLEYKRRNLREKTTDGGSLWVRS